MGHGGNIIEELKADHREVEAMFNAIMALPTGDSRRREMADKFTIELVRHSVAEEMYLYPAVREHILGGGAMADKEIEDHSKVEELLKQLEGMDADRAEFDTLVSRIITEVSGHVADEENRLFPALTGVCTPQQLNELGDKVRSAKEKAPTRPHPSAPSTPPMNKILAPGAGLVDRARDMLSGRGRS
jgi:hemerythrin superfamily protein